MCCGLGLKPECRASSEHLTPFAAGARLRLLREPQPLADLCKLTSQIFITKDRYLGKRKATLQAVWTAVLVNLHPIAAVLRANPA